MAEPTLAPDIEKTDAWLISAMKSVPEVKDLYITSIISAVLLEMEDARAMLQECRQCRLIR